MDKFLSFFGTIAIIGIAFTYFFGGLMDASHVTSGNGSNSILSQVKQGSDIMNKKTNGVGVSGAFKPGGQAKSMGASY